MTEGAIGMAIGHKKVMLNNVIFLGIFGLMSVDCYPNL